jgi:hypothetical protein
MPPYILLKVDVAFKYSGYYCYALHPAAAYSADLRIYRSGPDTGCPGPDRAADRTWSGQSNGAIQGKNSAVYSYCRLFGGLAPGLPENKIITSIPVVIAAESRQYWQNAWISAH